MQVLHSSETDKICSPRTRFGGYNRERNIGPFYFELYDAQATQFNRLEKVSEQKFNSMYFMFNCDVII